MQGLGRHFTGICLYKLEGSGGSTPEPPTPSTYTKITTLEDMTTGIRYVSSTTDVTYPYSLTVKSGAFFFETKKMDPTDNHTTSQYIYFKAGTGNNIFKIGNSGKDYGVLLYKKNITE